MSGNISGSMVTSIVFDVTGVRTGTEIASREIESLGGSAMRTSTVFKSAAQEVNGAADAIQHAAEMVELLSAKILAMQAKAEKGAVSLKTFGESAMRAGNSAVGGPDSFAVGEKKKRSAKEDADARIAEEKAETERIIAERRRRAEMIARREFEDARRFSAGARLAPGMRNDASNLSDSYFQIGRDANAWARGQRAAEGMRDAIFQARVALDPMVGMEARLAEEAREFQQNMRLAVTHSHLTKEQAEELLLTYQRLTDEQLKQARAQQASFLGMRNFGFMAQQGAYAIEDFAQVFGTMGVAGGIRAAGNNLTAMAAVAGPMVGVFASLAAAATMIGVHLWESSKALKEMDDMTKDFLRNLESASKESADLSVSIERQITEARRASYDDLRKMAEENISRVKSLHDEEKARLATAEKMRKVQELSDQAVQAQAEAEGWDDFFVRMFNEQFSFTASQLRLLMETGGAIYTTYLQSERSVKDAERIDAAITRRNVALEYQRRLLEQENSEENKRLKILEAQFEILKESENRRISMLNRSVELLSQQEEKEKNINELRADLTSAMQTQFLAEEAEMERVRVIEDLVERIIELQKQGKKSASDIASSINARFAGLNEEFSIEQQILETRKKINEQIEIAQRAGVINQGQAIDARQELQAALMLERERFDTQRRINELQEREKEIKKQLVAPAGLTGAIRFGSAEALQVFEQDRLRKVALNDSKPVVEELKQIRDEIKQQKAILERIAEERPVGAVLEGF